MNATIETYQKKFAALAIELMQLENEKTELIEESRRTGYKNSLSLKVLNAQIKRVETSMKLIRVPLVNMANAIKMWHERNAMVKVFIAEAKKKISERAAKIADLTTMLEVGATLKPSEIEYFTESGRILKRDERYLHNLLTQEYRHSKLKPKESLKYALDILEFIDGNTLDVTKKKLKLAPIPQHIDTEIPDILKLTQQTPIDPNAEEIDYDCMTDFDKEMLKAQNAPRIVHKI